jgi:hypothetical protein
MAGGKSRAGGKKASSKSKVKPRAFEDKPFVALTEFELKQVDDEIGSMLEEPTLDDARQGHGSLLVAAAVLVRADGQERVLYQGPEWGDGEGSLLSEHTVFAAPQLLERGERVRLDLVEVDVLENGTCSCAVRHGEGTERPQFGDIVKRYLAKDVADARRSRKPDDETYWLGVLTTRGGAKRIAFADKEDGRGESRARSAAVVLRTRRLKWLKPGESIDRMRLTLRLSTTNEWTATTTSEPVSGARR